MLHSVNIHSVGSTKKVRSCLQLSSDRMQNTAAARELKQERVVGQQVQQPHSRRKRFTTKVPQRQNSPRGA